MRLLNTETLELTDFIGQAPEYVILSHRWEKEEILFEDISKTPLSNPYNPARSKHGFAKVIGTCALAASDGYDWCWIDTCCIDKSSSAELQESINSMFRWYQQAQVCYAYLSDVADESSGWNEAFKNSQWFTRGWTLQELLGPSNVEFYSADWSPIGTKLCRTELITSITGIEIEALEFNWGAARDDFCAAQKFSWAAHRQVSKAEDSAYCLFGLFDINMPLLYGEGGAKAFQRLQQAVYEQSADPTLFLFARAFRLSNVPMLANSTEYFCRRYPCSTCWLIGVGDLFPKIPYSSIIRSEVPSQVSVDDAHYIRVVQQGVIVKLPLMKHESSHGLDNIVEQWDLSEGYVAILPLYRRGHKGFLFGIVLQRVSPLGYVRRYANVVHLDVNSLQIDQRKQGAFTVHTSVPTTIFSSSLLPRTESPRIKITHFVFNSQFFRALDWRSKIRNETWIQGHVQANFPLPQQNEQLLLTMSFQSLASPELVGKVVLRYTACRINLCEISFSRGQRCLVQWKAESTGQLQRCMRVDVPIDRTGYSLRVVARSIAVPRYMWLRMIGSEGLKHLNSSLRSQGRLSDYSIEAAYRLCVSTFRKESQLSIPEPGSHGQVTQGEGWVI